jgi:hypothetical protein
MAPWPVHVKKPGVPCGEPRFWLFQNGSGVVMLVLTGLRFAATGYPNPPGRNRYDKDKQNQYVHCYSPLLNMAPAAKHATALANSPMIRHAPYQVTWLSVNETRRRSQ